jgi:hypothetical protein
MGGPHAHTGPCNDGHASSRLASTGGLPIQDANRFHEPSSSASAIAAPELEIEGVVDH